MPDVEAPHARVMRRILVERCRAANDDRLRGEKSRDGAAGLCLRLVGVA
jgi:hypothetical protein